MLSPFHDFFFANPFFAKIQSFPLNVKESLERFLQFEVECSQSDLMVPKENWGLLWLKNGLFVFFF
jgi:hypothetical protein